MFMNSAKTADEATAANPLLSFPFQFNLQQVRLISGYCGVTLDQLETGQLLLTSIAKEREGESEKRKMLFLQMLESAALGAQIASSSE